MIYFLKSVLPWIIIAALILIVFLRKIYAKHDYDEASGQKRKSFAESGMCIGMCVGIVVSSVFRIIPLGCGLAGGMLLGLFIGFCVTKK